MTLQYDLEFTSSSLAARLEDDCPDVVLAVLELGPTVSSLHFILFKLLCDEIIKKNF